jgi:hypothetical protein
MALTELKDSTKAKAKYTAQKGRQAWPAPQVTKLSHWVVGTGHKS